VSQRARAKITALGTYVPPRVLTNYDFEKMVDTSDEWILTRTGIRERHIVDKGVATSDLAVEAAKSALAHRGIEPDDLDVIVVATVTPDMFFPATACLVQHKLGIKKVWGFDLSAACSAFVYALQAGTQFVASGGCSLYMPGGGSLHPSTHETVAKNMHVVHQDGQAVFKYAVRKMGEVCEKLLARNGFSAADVDCFIPHQANQRIIKSTAERLGLKPESVIINIDRYGNTTAGTIPLAMQTAIDEGRLKKGDLVLLASVGAGFTVGATLLRWTI
jgi:3-oxoacyl-[acyl-carrier-protein] synthase-3